MNGVNGDAYGIKGALKFQVRVLVTGSRRINISATQGSSQSSTNEDWTFVHDVIISADSATVLIAAATSYKNYHDVSGNPEAITENQITAAAAKNV